MKTLMIAIALVTSFTVTSAFAQNKKTMTAQDLAQTLSNVTTQEGLINVGGVPITVSNVTVQDLVTVQRVLNNSELNLLNNALNGNLRDISVQITDLLRNANILNKNQVVVGVLSDQDGVKFVTRNLRSAK